MTHPEEKTVKNLQLNNQDNACQNMDIVPLKRTKCGPSPPALRLMLLEPPEAAGKTK